MSVTQWGRAEALLQEMIPRVRCPTEGFVRTIHPHGTGK
jgi:hypothetical protein